MDPANSITAWIEEVRLGDEDAAQRLWERYYERLVRLARKQMVAMRRRVEDEEDVVQEAFDAFFRAIRQPGRFAELHDRNGLWNLLARITENQVRDVRRQQGRKKRGDRFVRGGSIMQSNGQSQPGGFNNVPDPTPEFAEDFAIGCEHLLHALEPQEQKIALLKLANYTNDEIALQLGCAAETVRRKIKVIRHKWKEVSG